MSAVSVAIRFSHSRRLETALALDMCASSRWAPGLRLELQGYESPVFPDTDTTVTTSDLGWLTDLHWRSLSLASKAFYATMYSPGQQGLDFFDICAESAQRLREGWRLCENCDDRLYAWGQP